MNDAATKAYSQCDGAILSAAVADFSPKSFENEKIKKKGEMTLELQSTPDIAKNLGKVKTEKQFLVGFALETNDEENNAQQKLKRKNFDFIVLNSMKEENTCFGFDTNKIRIIHKTGEIKNFDLKAKTEVAQDIVNEIINLK
jgi:phosphopantothenoylcysteine decarboxylase/phosphopantothenate--cysteine ligase